MDSPAQQNGGLTRSHPLRDFGGCRGRERTAQTVAKRSARGLPYSELPYSEWQTLSRTQPEHRTTARQSTRDPCRVAGLRAALRPAAQICLTADSRAAPVQLAVVLEESEQGPKRLPRVESPLGRRAEQGAQGGAPRRRQQRGEHGLRLAQVKVGRGCPCQRTAARSKRSGSCSRSSTVKAGASARSGRPNSGAAVRRAPGP